MAWLISIIALVIEIPADRENYPSDRFRIDAPASVSLATFSCTSVPSLVNVGGGCYPAPGVNFSLALVAACGNPGRNTAGLICRFKMCKQTDAIL